MNFMSNDLSENPEFKIIQEHLNLQSGNVLLFSNNSKLRNSLSSEKLQVFSSPNQTISDKIDNFLSTDTFQAEFSKHDQKFDTIIIHDLFEEIKHPGLFLQNLDSILTNEGTIICSISNFYHINNIINLLAGLYQNHLFDKTLASYDLDTILFLLNKNNLHITKLFRIKEEFLPEKTNLDVTIIPSKLVDIIQKISDYNTSQYVLMIGKGKTISSENLEFASQFPKNYLLPKLQELFEKFSELEKSVSDKDKLIQGFEESIKEMTSYSGTSFIKKDKVIHGLEDSIEEQKTYTSTSLIKKDKLIHGLEDSIEEQKTYTSTSLMKKDKIIHGLEESIEEQKTYTNTSLMKKDKIIEGHENSIKEQREYVKNLEEQIRQLESTLKKFAFWKK